MAAKPARPVDPLGSGEQSNGLALTVPAAMLDAIAERAAELLADRLAAETAPWLDVNGAADHLACAPSRIYALVSAKRIPHHRDGSRLLFRRAELDEWVESGGGKRP